MTDHKKTPSHPITLKGISVPPPAFKASVGQYSQISENDSEVFELIPSLIIEQKKALRHLIHAKRYMEKAGTYEDSGLDFAISCAITDLNDLQKKDK